MTRYSEHAVVAQIIGAGEISPSSAEITLDDSWSPFAQGTLTAKIPADADLLAAADPRDGAPRVSMLLSERVGVSAPLSAIGGPGATLGGLFAGGTLADVTAAHFRPWNDDSGTGSRLRVNLGIRRRRLDHRAGTMLLELASDEALLQDYALLSTVPETPGSTSVRTAVAFALGKIGATLAEDAADAQVDEAEALTWYPGTTGWDYCHGLVQATNLRLWCDELGVWHLDPKDEVLADRATTLAEFTDAAEDIDREGEWCDGVVVEYEWTDANDVRRLRRDIAGSASSSRVIHVRYTTPYPGRGAAQRILDRANRRGRVLELTGLPRYSAYPAGLLTALPPNTPAQVGVVERVQFTVPEDGAASMTVQSRGLVDTSAAAWVLIPEDASWLAEPAGSWLTEPIGVA